MKVAKKPFSWKVLLFDVNAQKIVEHDILKYLEDEVKKLKKKVNYSDKEEFATLLRNRLMWQYWSRSEYETVIYEVDGKLMITAWCGCYDREKTAEPVEGRLGINWRKLYNEIGTRRYECKIDAWDQVEHRWEEFVDFVWYYRHKYQRKQVT